MDERNLSRVKQWPSNEMVKAIDRIPMVCAPCIHCRTSSPYPLVSFSIYSVLRDLYKRKLHRMQKPARKYPLSRVVRRFDVAPKHFPTALLCLPMGFPIDTFESVPPNFEHPTFFSLHSLFFSPPPASLSFFSR